MYRFRNTKEKRFLRTRANIRGTGDKPRLSVFRSNKYIYAQLIDDFSGVTLVSVDSEVLAAHKGKSKTEAAAILGEKMAEKAKEKGITKAIFDKGGYLSLIHISEPTRPY